MFQYFRFRESRIEWNGLTAPISYLFVDNHRNLQNFISPAFFAIAPKKKAVFGLYQVAAIEEARLQMAETNAKAVHAAKTADEQAREPGC